MKRRNPKHNNEPKPENTLSREQETEGNFDRLLVRIHGFSGKELEKMPEKERKSVNCLGCLAVIIVIVVPATFLVSAAFAYMVATLAVE